MTERDIRNTTEQREEMAEDDVPQDTITIVEIEKPMNRLKNGKLAGHDSITTEITKNMRSAGEEAILEIICRKTWTEESVSNY